jgi:homoserine kinase type II
VAVYTHVSPDQVRAFLADYDIGDMQALSGIREGVENSNYLLVTDRGRFILTLYEKRVDPADLPFFLNLMEHLAGKGVPCPVPVHGRDGRSLRQLAGRPAAIVSFLKGRSLRRIEPAHCASLGAALARLHLAGCDFGMQRANALSVDHWRRLYLSCRGRADEVEPGLARELEIELDVLEAQWPRHLPSGIVHADLFPDNVFFEDSRVTGLIDFYFACNDLYAYDLAICVNAWCFERGGEFNITKARALLQGYSSVRPLAAAEIEALPMLARGAAMRFLLTRLYDWLNRVEGALVLPKDPMEYVYRLRFHRGIAGPGAYGLASS